MTFRHVKLDYMVINLLYQKGVLRTHRQVATLAALNVNNATEINRTCTFFCLLLLKMVNYCHVLGCPNQSDREKHLEYYRLPKVKTNQGEPSEKRRHLWLVKLNQDFAGQES